MGFWGTGMHGHTSYVLDPFWESQLQVVYKPYQSGSHIIIVSCSTMTLEIINRHVSLFPHLQNGSPQDVIIIAKDNDSNYHFRVLTLNPSLNALYTFC